MNVPTVATARLEDVHVPSVEVDSWVAVTVVVDGADKKGRLTDEPCDEIATACDLNATLTTKVATPALKFESPGTVKVILAVPGIPKVIVAFESPPGTSPESLTTEATAEFDDAQTPAVELDL